MEEAVQIANIRDNKLLIDTDSFGKILDKVGDRSVAIVSVNGPLRSGKSYIINHFLRYLTAADASEDWFAKTLPVEFHWKNSSERQTIGILVWPEPLVLQSEGREVAVLLVDTQGCFDDKTTTIENSLIFAFGCMISSVLIYNIKNQLAEDVLQFLQLFVGYAKVVIDQDDRESFAELVFLIRDWQFPGDFRFGYYDDGYSCSDRNFKREKLDVQPDMAAESRVVHQEILASFRDVGCCLMPYPGNELAYYDKSQNADPLFVQTIKDFLPRIFPSDRSIAKKVGGKEVTGTELKQLVVKWAELFASTEIPAVQNVAEATAEVQNAMASSVALKFYHGDLASTVNAADGLPDEELAVIHATKRQEALDMFQRMKRIRHEAIQKKYLESLTNDIEGSFGSYHAINATKRQIRENKAASVAETNRLRQEMMRQVAEAHRRANRGGGKLCIVM